LTHPPQLVYVLRIYVNHIIIISSRIDTHTHTPACMCNCH